MTQGQPGAIQIWARYPVLPLTTCMPISSSLQFQIGIKTVPVPLRRLSQMLRKDSATPGTKEVYEK